jgi:hypothetical protein
MRDAARLAFRVHVDLEHARHVDELEVARLLSLRNEVDVRLRLAPVQHPVQPEAA